MKVFFTVFCTLICTICTFNASATHNRAGEITYRHLSGFTYEVTITTCTKTSVIADRPWLSINWGDLPSGATLDSLERQLPINFLGGEIDAQINTYVGVHTYGGPGIFEITVLDPNRNAGVLNVPGSVNQPFCIRSTLIINPQTGNNNSVVLLNPAKENACLNKLWIHNPGAFDPDGDILRYSLVSCLGDSCLSIQGYQFPDVYSSANDIFAIDSETGDVTWEFPPEVGEYNIAILIEEFREVNGTLIKVGDVLRDMQITVQLCTNNPPEIDPINEICLVAGTSIDIDVTATDPDGDPVILTALGGPLSETVNLASFNSSNGNGEFSWTPFCEEVRPNPYQVVFKAEDQLNQVPLTDLESWFITVVAPPVENPVADPVGNTFQLSWDPTPCLDAFTEIEQTQGVYKIYRRFGLANFEPEECELGVPESTGYSLIAEVDGLNNTEYLDEDVFFGGQYCYIIVTCLPNGSESIASEEFCGQLDKTGPVLTNASVEQTSTSEGEVFVAWSPPTLLDTDVFPGPYLYKLYHNADFGNASNLILETALQLSIDNPDTLFTHQGINTETTPNAYRVELYSGDDLIQTSAPASSIFLELIPDDNEITLVMNLNQPWQNLNYEIFRFNNDLGDFESIGTSMEPTYVDEGLTNNVEYCYYVEATGTYGAPSIIDPLINLSQEVCAEPIDFTPPCPPTLSVDGDCELETSSLSWNNLNNSCADDVIAYNIYYAATPELPLEYIATLDSATDTTFVFNELSDLNTIAGCFAVTALDSMLVYNGGFVNQNESDLSEVICIDNCPEYDIPNVFTPNSDGFNDFYVPFPYKFVESIDLKVFNRWGGLVFESTDPAINWDGKDMESGNVVSDGVYFYILKVNTIRLEGIVQDEQSGTIQVVAGENQNTNEN